MSLSPTDGLECLTTGAAMGIAVVSAAVMFFTAGIFSGVLVFYCISKHRSQSSKLESPSFQQQQQPVLSSNPLQQTGPEYEEVVELRQNRAYELTQTGIEMRANESYQPVQH